MDDEGEAVCYWRCPNCGQIHFAEAPPDMCAFCQDFTTWELISEKQQVEPTDGEQPTQPIQPRLFD